MNISVDKLHKKKIEETKEKQLFQRTCRSFERLKLDYRPEYYKPRTIVAEHGRVHLPTRKISALKLILLTVKFVGEKGKSSPSIQPQQH